MGQGMDKNQSQLPGVEWRQTDRGLAPFIEGFEVAWAPQPGAQVVFLRCPLFEALLEGPRGGGKTDTLIMDFCQHVGQGFGEDYRGLVVRQSFPQLADFIAKTKKWIPKLWPSATFREHPWPTWMWATKETLRIGYIETEDDYWKNYHGHAYCWIGFEELTTWANDKPYQILKACCRSTHPRIPIRYRSTTNPDGVGHNWVKRWFGLPVPAGRTIGRVIDGEGDLKRVAVHSTLEENQVLLAAQPNYRQQIVQAAGSPSRRKAWIEGSWDITSGGMVDDVWAPGHHVIQDVPWALLLRSQWRINRSYDHGISKPFSVGWWAESNGEPIELPGGRKIGLVPGDLFRVAEWYGWNGSDNEGIRMAPMEIADGITKREAEWGISQRCRTTNPADTSIFDEAFEPTKSVAGEMRKRGVYWEPADKGPGSRKQGWQLLREMLANALPVKEGIREKPGLFVCEGCEHFIRTVPILPRSKKDQDDVDTESEDHVGDEVRYRLRERRKDIGFKKTWR